MKEILSSKNPLVKEIKKLHKKKERDEKKQYVIEGFHLIEEAKNSGAIIEWILFNQRGQAEWANWLETCDPEKLIFVSDEVLNSLSDLPTPQGILAVINKNEADHLAEFRGGWLLLDNVQDPGNVGTMIRTADAAGLAGVIIGEGTADIYSTKVLRAMQGSNYHLPVIHGNLADILQQFIQNQIPIYGTELNEQAVDYLKVNKAENYGLIMGNEGQGVSATLLAQTTQNIYIPIRGQAESLNVAVAAGILMYHLS